MAHNMYNKRNYFYDVRNLPYSYFHGHPMEVMEYQRGRPTKLPVRQLNRQFKRTVIPFGNENQLDERSALVISVQQQPTAKGKIACLVFAAASCDIAETDEIPSGGVSVPETLAPQFVQQLRKLAKWKGGSGGGNEKPPSGGQGLAFEDQVFKAQIALLPGGEYAIKILSETRSRDPQERRELSFALIPMEPTALSKFRTALADLLISESPLYHTESLQVSDGSKFYLDLIKEETAHYLKVSHVTRDFRSIVIVPAEDLEALRDQLDTCLKAIKTQQQLLPGDETSSGDKAAGKRKRGRNNPRRRPPAAGQKRRPGARGSGARGGSSGSEGKENGEAATASPLDADAKGDEGCQLAAPSAAAAPEPCGGEDGQRAEPRPVENGDAESGGNKPPASQ